MGARNNYNEQYARLTLTELFLLFILCAYALGMQKVYIHTCTLS